jgi:hypothetical protein
MKRRSRLANHAPQCPFAFRFNVHLMTILDTSQPNGVANGPAFELENVTLAKPVRVSGRSLLHRAAAAMLAVAKGRWRCLRSPRGGGRACSVAAAPLC